MTSECRPARDRSQSESVGILLLTAVFVVLAGAVGAFTITKFVSTGEAQPLLEIDGNATTQYVTVTHDGGETLRVDDLEVVVQGASDRRYALGSFTQRVGDDTTRFEPGDGWRHPTEVDGSTLDVLLVHEPTNAVVARATFDVRVTIAARFTTTPSSPIQGDSISFDAADSTVKGGTIASYEWDVTNDGTTDYTGQTASHTFTDDGSYPVTLTITADDGRTASTTTDVVVTNARPTASFTVSPSPAGPGETVTVDASGSSDPDGSISSYSWDFGDGTTATGQTATHAYGSVGDYPIELTVTDDDGGTDTARRTLTVSRAYFDVSIGSTNTPVTEGETLSVDATVNNTGAVSGTQSVELSIDGTVEDTQSVTLAPSDAPQTVTLTWQTAAGDSSGSPYTATVASENTSDSTSVSVVQQQAILSIADVRGLTDQTTGHSYQAAVDVEETNDVETQNLAVRLVIEDGSGTEVFNQTDSSVGPLQNAVGTADYPIGTLDAGSYTYTVRADADNAAETTTTGSFTVQSIPVAAIDAVTDQSTRCGNWNQQKQRCNGNSQHSFQFQVDYSGSDADGDLTQLAIELLNPDGTVVDSATSNYGGVTSASETTTLSYSSQSYWTQDFTIRVTATDAQGNTDTVTRTETADGQ